MNVESMPFDQYQRYRLVSDLLDAVRPRGKSLRVLDVGGRTALLRGFLPKDTITLVDVEASDQRGLVLGDGARLPFRDASFDVVAAFDTLEHVPPKLRADFVRECARVSRGHVFLAGPYHSDRVAEAERILQSFLKDKLGFEHRYLEEHRHNGLPSMAATEKLLVAAGARVAHVGHANLERWLALMALAMFLDHDPALRGLAARVHEFYNRALYASDHAEPVYRHVVIAALGDAVLPKAERVLTPPPAPAGALAPFPELIAGLAAFDRERGVWREERAKLDAARADLLRDLEGHRATLEALDSDLALEREQTARLEALLSSEREQAAASIATLEADLAHHRESIAELEQASLALREGRAELEALLESERAQASLSIDALKSDLDGHRARITDLEALALAREAEFVRERESLREIVDALERDLAGHRESLAHVEAELALREEHLERLRGDLRSEREAAMATIAELNVALEAHRSERGALIAASEALRVERDGVLTRWQDDRAQAAAVTLELRQAIDAHVARGASLEAALAREQDATKEVVRTLQADLDEHRRVLSALRQQTDERAQVIAALEQARASDAQALTALREHYEGQIAAHVGVQTELGAELDRHRAAQAELMDALSRTREEAASIQRELQAGLAANAALARTLAEREAEIQQLRGLLRSRWKNFKRAFSPRKPRF